MYKQLILMFISIIFCISCGVKTYYNIHNFADPKTQKELKNLSLEEFLSKLGFKSSNSCSTAYSEALPEAVSNYFKAHNGYCDSKYHNYMNCFINNDFKLRVEIRKNCVTTDRKYYDAEVAYEERERKRAEREAERKRIEEERKKKEEEERISMLRSRKGQFVMDFYLMGSTPSSRDAKSCWDACSKVNYNRTGYWTIDEALQNGWAVKQILGDISQSGVTYYNCTCQGKKYIMSK